VHGGTHPAVAHGSVCLPAKQEGGGWAQGGFSWQTAHGELLLGHQSVTCAFWALPQCYVTCGHVLYGEASTTHSVLLFAVLWEDPEQDDVAVVEWMDIIFLI